MEKNCYPSAALKLLESHFEVEYFETETSQELLAWLEGRDFQVIFTKLGLAMDAMLMDSLPSLTYIVTPTTGLNHIDLDYAGKNNIEVISLKGEQDFLKEITSTAEHTWALLLALLRNIPAAHADVLAGNWRRTPFLAGELYGKTLGIIGYGRLGKIVARYALAFGMKVVANDTQVSVFQDEEGVIPVELDDLLTESDIISLHIPYNEANCRFFDAEKFVITKPGMLLINTSRGEVVDEEALLQSLINGQTGGAAIDVLEGDSIWETTVPSSHPLINYARNNRNLIISPHIGGYGKESIERTRKFIIKKFIEISMPQGHLFDYENKIK